MTQVQWNKQFLALRSALVDDLKDRNGNKLHLTVSALMKVAKKHIPDFEYTHTMRSRIRELLAEVDVRAVLGRHTANFIYLKPVDVPKEQWSAIIANGVDSIIAFMESRKAYEYGMYRKGLCAYMPIWPDCAEFNTQLQNAVQARGYTLTLTRTLAWIRKVKKQPDEIPQMHQYSGVSLFEALMNPALSHKRRWLNGYTHALSCNTSAVQLDTDVKCADQNSMVRHVAIFPGAILLVNQSAYEIIMRGARSAEVEYKVQVL